MTSSSSYRTTTAAVVVVAVVAVAAAAFVVVVVVDDLDSSRMRRSWRLIWDASFAVSFSVFGDVCVLVGPNQSHDSKLLVL